MSLSATEEVFVLIFSSIIVCLIWWRFVSKMGFKGNDRWLYTLSMVVPVTTVITLIYLLFWPWPIHEENKKLKEYIKKLESQRFSSSGSSEDNVDIELDRLRGEMGMTQMKGKRNPKK